MKANTIELGVYAVEKLPIGEFVRRLDAKKLRDNIAAPQEKIYKRGEYDRTSKRYALQDVEDTSREVYVKKGTMLYAGFTY